MLALRLELTVLLPFQLAGLPSAVALCFVSLWQYRHEVRELLEVQYEFQMVPFEALSLWYRGDGIFGGVIERFESTAVVWWQVIQVTAVELLVL